MSSSPATATDHSASCVTTTTSVTLWLVLSTTLPILLNIGSLFLIAFAIWQVKQVKKMCEKVTASTHWLSRTAVRVGIGPTAKKAILEYSKGKPEFAKLLGASQQS